MYKMHRAKMEVTVHNVEVFANVMCVEGNKCSEEQIGAQRANCQIGHIFTWNDGQGRKLSVKVASPSP